MVRTRLLKKKADALSSQEVTDAAAIGRLLNPRSLLFLVPYLASNCSISQAATELDVSIARMSYQTKKLEAAGLIAPVATRNRAGRAQVIYRSIADEFTIRLADVGTGDLEAFLLDSEELFRTALARGLVATMASVHDPANISLRLRPSPHGGIDFEPITAAGRAVHEVTPSFTSWMTLGLSSNEADELHQDILELWTKWHNRTPSGPPHLVRLAFAPLDTQARISGRAQQSTTRSQARAESDVH